MDSRVLGDYGAPFVDETGVANPQSEVSAAKFNRMCEDLAHGSRTSPRAEVTFVPTSTGAPTTVSAANVTIDSHWGSGDAQKPVVTKTATGLYTITFAATYTDALSVVQSVVFRSGVGGAITNTADNDTAKIVSIASNVVNVALFRAGAASDWAGAGQAVFWLR